MIDFWPLPTGKILLISPWCLTSHWSCHKGLTGSVVRDNVGLDHRVSYSFSSFVRRSFSSRCNNRWTRHSRDASVISPLLVFRFRANSFVCLAAVYLAPCFLSQLPSFANEHQWNVCESSSTMLNSSLVLPSREILSSSMYRWSICNRSSRECVEKRMIKSMETRLIFHRTIKDSLMWNNQWFEKKVQGFVYLQDEFFSILLSS
jgi:hypothetical protein